MMLPVTDDRDTGPFFAAAREGRLDYTGCTDCNRGVHPPASYCPHCGGRTSWITASGKGTLYTFGVVNHTVHPDFPAPYTVVLVELDDQPDVRLCGHIPGAPDLKIGQKMEVYFERKTDDVVLPQWRVADENS